MASRPRPSRVWNTKRFKSRNLWAGGVKVFWAQKERFLGAKGVDFWAQTERNFWALGKRFLGAKGVHFWALGKRFLGLGYIQLVPFRFSSCSWLKRLPDNIEGTGGYCNHHRCITHCTRCLKSAHAHKKLSPEIDSFCAQKSRSVCAQKSLLLRPEIDFCCAQKSHSVCAQKSTPFAPRKLLRPRT